MTNRIAYPDASVDEPVWSLAGSEGLYRRLVEHQLVAASPAPVVGELES